MYVAWSQRLCKQLELHPLFSCENYRSLADLTVATIFHCFMKFSYDLSHSGDVLLWVVVRRPSVLLKKCIFSFKIFFSTPEHGADKLNSM